MRLASWASLLAIILATSANAAKPTYPNNCRTHPAGWLGPESRFGDIASPNSVKLRKDGSLRWNGNPVSDSELLRLLIQTARLNPRPLVLVTIQPATPCSRVKQVRLLMNNTAICKHGHCGEGSAWPFPASVK